VQDVEQDRAGTQRFEDSSRADRVANALVDAILHRNIEVVAHVGETRNLNGVDDEIAISRSA
jgi:hypothetical protein